jgi:signal transduction histidine kinase
LVGLDVEHGPLGAVTRRILTLVAGHAAVAGGLLATLVATRPVWHESGSVFAAVAFAAAFTLVGLLPMHLELGRSACTVTLVEAVLVLALLHLGPASIVLAAAGGEAAACLAHRQSLLKVVYNTTATAAAVLLAVVVDAGVAHLAGTADWAPWTGAVVGVACYAAMSQASTSLVLRVVEGRRLMAVLRASMSTAALATLVSASIGVTVAALYAAHPAAPLLLVPLIVTVALETRRLAAHRAEHLRFERLYAASSRTAGLQEFDAALAVSAAEARSLVTGAAAVCCAPDRDGTWRGMLVDDRGSRVASVELVAAVVDLVDEGSGVPAELPVTAIADAARADLPSASTVVVAGPGRAGESPVALAVVRDIRGDDQAEARSEVLGAFAGHAALIATNARLYGEVEEALRHQVDLNRQKDDFLAAVSHELRTPLAAVLGSVATLRRLDQRLDAENRERFFDMAARQGKRLQRLIEELLMIAAVDQREAACLQEPVDLVAMTSELADDLQELAGDRIVVAVAPGAERVQTDGTKLRQVLVNLVENAAKYAPDGRIKVLAWPHTPGAGDIAVTVVDHGPGVPADQRERVFERFVQLDQSSTRTQGGTGLGLYLCRRLTELLGAELTLAETPGGGCTFTLVLPQPMEDEDMQTPTATRATSLPVDVIPDTEEVTA